MSISRRQFLQLCASASGSLLLSVSIPQIAMASGNSNAAIEPNHWSVYLTINPDNSIVIESPVQDMGQHMKTTGPMMIAEELDADWDLISVIAATTHITKKGEGYAYKNADMSTGGSQAVRQTWQYFREAGAVVKKSLMLAAATKWGCNIDQVYSEKSFVYRKGSQQKFSYGQLAPAAAKLPIPTGPISLKACKDYKLFGTDVTTVDIDEMLTGKPLYGIDMEMDNMLHAVIERCPHFQGKVKSVDDAAALKVPGVLKTLPMALQMNEKGDTRVLSAGIAIVATSLWSAMKARKALKIVWDKGPYASESDTSLRQSFQQLCHGTEAGKVIVDEGDVTAGLSNAARVFEQTYQTAHMAHACMEPLNAIVSAEKGRATVITGHQNPLSVATSVGKILNLDPFNVKVINTRMGGGFGRRYKDDFVMEAALIAKHFTQPVKVTWSREDEVSQDFFGQGVCAKVRAGVDSQGKLHSWEQREAHINSHIRYSCFPYGLVDNFRIHQLKAGGGTPLGAWRGPGHIQQAFITESMIDEIAHAYQKDPLTYRLELLGDERDIKYEGWGAEVANTGRMAKCLQSAAKMADWGKKRPPGVGLGIAGHFTFGSYAAFVVEVDTRAALGLKERGSTEKGTMQITKAWGAIDCGLPLNTNHIANQMQGGFIDGLNAALFNEVKISQGKVDNTNFHTLRWMKMADSPQDIQVDIIKNDYPPTGVGEPPTAPAAAALANAIFAATGERLRTLPLKSATSEV
ncbi:MAG: isoquinoline 1-oxidoreductase beta subunit [Phenylobacterium sp.]|jgi:isoquinoline 1-oxidoreductase beta subunit